MSPASRGREGRTLAAPAVLGVLAVLVGMVLVVVALVGQVPTPPSPGTAARPTASAGGAPTGPGADAARSTSTPDASASAARAPRTASGSGTTAPADAAPRTSDAPEPEPEAAPVEYLPRSEPVRVRVPAIDVESPLHDLGLAEDGTLLVPTGDLVDEAAWYSGSPTPGEVGPSVIEGHVTGPGGRPSVFFRLGELDAGDRVEVDRADGSTAVFEVYAVESHPKDRFPTVRVYGQTDGPEMRLITCGGEFDTVSGHHVDNTVVYARLVPQG